MAEELKLPIKTVVDYSDLDRMPNQVERATRSAQRRAQTAMRDPRTGQFMGRPRWYGPFEGADAPIPPRLPQQTYVPARPARVLSAEERRAKDEEYAYQQAKAQAFLDKVEKPLIKKRGEAQLDWDAKVGKRRDETTKQWFRRLEGMDRAAARQQRQREADHRRPRQRAALGALRGFGQEALQGTGVPFPFLGMGAAFIGGAVAAGVAAQAVRASVDQVMAVGKATRGLSTDLNITRAASARFIATGQQFNVTSEHMSKALSHAGQQVQTNMSLFRRLGVEVYDATGNTRDYADVINDARDAISRIGDPGIQAAMAIELFGDAAKQTVPFWRATMAQMGASQGAIDQQVSSIERATAATERWDNATARLGTTWARIGQAIGAPLAEGVASGLEGITDDRSLLEKMRDFAMDWLPWGQPGRIARQITMPVMPKVDPSGVRDAHDRITQDIGRVAELDAIVRVRFDQAIEAKSAVNSLTQSLADLDHAAQVRIFGFGTALENYANFLEDREMALEMRTAALTMTLGEFRKAEQTEAQRARSQERFFIAFRPAWNLQWQQEDRRFERTKTQMERQLSFTAIQNGWAEEREGKEREIIALRLAANAALGINVDKELEAARKNLQARLIQQGLVDQGRALDMNINLNAVGIDWSKIGLSREDAELLFIQVFERVALESRSHIRQASASVGGTFMVTQ